MSDASIEIVARRVWSLCTERAGSLPFHGWHHVDFVRAKAVGFAGRNGADVVVVELAALVHDLNYLVEPNSPASAGRDLRAEILAAAGVAPTVAARVDDVVVEAEMGTRGRHVSLEAQALSDADTLFKALPVTPVVLAHRYLAENRVTLRELADKIVGEQRPAHDHGFYFYDEAAAATYAHWATANLELWRCIQESLADPTVERLLADVDRCATPLAAAPG